MNILCEEIQSTLLDNIKNIVFIVTPIATFLLALFTIDKWKKEYKTKVYFDCSFRLLKSAYSLRDLFMSMRTPMIFVWEMLPKTSENEGDYERKNVIYYLNNRNKPFQEALNNFYSIFPEVEILLGKEVIKMCKDINLILLDYNMAVDEYIQLNGNTNNRDHYAEVSSRVFNNRTPDKLGEEMNSAIAKIDSAVSEYLKLKV